MTQYVTRGVNPYPVALEALIAAYGALAPHGPVHLTETKVFSVPESGPHPKSDPALGTTRGDISTRYSDDATSAWDATA